MQNSLFLCVYFAVNIKMSNEGSDDGEISSEEFEDFYKVWNSRLYVPEAHLGVTEQTFKERTPSYDKYLNHFKIIQQQDEEEEEILEFASKTNYHEITSSGRFSNITKNDILFYYNPTNNARFKQLQQRIATEQQEYQSFLHHCAQKHLHQYIFLNPLFKQQIKNETRMAIEKSVKEIKTRFSLQKTITLEDMLASPDTSFEFNNTVQTQKNITDYNTEVSYKENLSSYRILHSEDLQKVSREDQASMCITNDCKVYIDSTSLLNILEGFVSSSLDWLIPLQVVEKESKKLLLFGAPLPRRCVTTRQINSLYYDNCLRNCFKVNEECAVNMFSCGDFKILVQAQTDIKDGSRSYCICTKPEFQCSLGYELFSVQDLCDFWWKSRLSNSDGIVCCRVDVRNDRLIHTDTYTRDILCSSGCPYIPKAYFKHIHHLLSTFYECQPGTYLLERASGNSSIFVFGQNESGITTLGTKYRLTLSNKQELVVDTEFPWLPIDTKIIPSHYIQREEIPWLFPLMTTEPLGKKKKKHLKRKLPPPQNNRIKPAVDEEFFSGQLSSALKVLYKKNEKQAAKVLTQEENEEF